MVIGTDLVKSAQIHSLGPPERWQMLQKDGHTYEAHGWIIGRGATGTADRRSEVEIALLTDGRFHVSRLDNSGSLATRSSGFFESSGEVLTWLSNGDQEFDDTAQAAWADASARVIGFRTPSVNL